MNTIDQHSNDSSDDRATVSGDEAGAAFDGHRDGSVDAEFMQRLLLQNDTLDGFLQQLVTSVAADTGLHCGITVRGTNQTGPYTVASSDDWTSKFDEVQYHDGAGPCLESLHTGQPVVVSDMRTETRWAPFPEHAAALGVRATLSYPLISENISLGAVNMYSEQLMEPGPDLHARASGIAGHAAGAVGLALRMADQDRLIVALRQSLTSRSTIDQAIGVLMAQQRCDDRTAFELLRSASQGRNVKLRDVAAAIVASVNRSTRDSGPRRY